MPTFDTVDSQSTYTVPTGCEAITAEIIGGTGGAGNDNNGYSGGQGGPGGRLVGELPVTAGETFTVSIGQDGDDGDDSAAGAGGQSPLQGGQTGGGGGGGFGVGGGGGAPSGLVRDSDGAVIGVGEGGGGGSGGGSDTETSGAGGGGARGGAGGSGGPDSQDGGDGTGTGAGGDGADGDYSGGLDGQAGGTTAHGDLAVETTDSSTAAPKVVITEHYPPPTPTNLTIDGVADRSLDLSWDDPATDSTTENEDHYDVLLSTDGGSTFSVVKTVAADSTSTTVSGLRNGEEFVAKVRAVTDDGITRDSGTDTDQTTLPDVSGLVLDASVEDQFTASWNDVSNYGDYRIEWRETGASSWPNSVTQGQDDDDRVITGLEDGEKYDVRVRAETEHTQSAWATANDVTLIPAPSGFAVPDQPLAGTDTTLDCSWTDNSDNPDEVYRVFISSDGGSSFSDESGALAANTETHTTDPLPHNVTFTLKARVETEHVYADSGTVTVTTALEPGTGDWIALVDGETGSERMSIDNAIESLNWAREHTALGDWRATVPHGPSLEDWVFSEVYIFHDDQLTFRGFLELVDSNEGSATTTLGGYGVARKLERDEAAVRYQNELAWEAIQDYLNNHSNIGGTVHEPSSQQVTGAQAQYIDTQTEWADATPTFSSSVPLRAENGALRTEQTLYWTEAETAYNTVGSSVFSSDMSGGEAIEIAAQYDRVVERYALERTIANEDIGLRARLRVPNLSHPEFRVYVDDELVEVIGKDALQQDSSPRWFEFSASTTTDDPDTGDTDESGTPIGDLSGTVEVEIKVIDPTAGEDPVYIDGLALYDERFSYTWDNSTDSNDALDGPEWYPNPQSETETTLAQAESVYNIDSATANLTINETSADQRIGLSFDGGSTWDYATNTDTHTASSNIATSTVLTKLRLGRAGSGATTTPTQGYEPMQVDISETLVDGNTLGVIEDERYDATHLSNIQKLCKRAGMRFVHEHATDSVSLEVFAEGEITKSADWVTINRRRSVDVRGYANKVIGKGARQADGTRLRSVIQDTDEINAVGETVVYSFTDPSLKTQQDLDSATRTTLNNRLDEDSLSGSIEAMPALVDPGYSYPIDAWGTEEIPKYLACERVTYQLSPGDGSTVIEFEKPEGLGGDINSTRTGVDETKDAI